MRRRGAVHGLLNPPVQKEANQALLTRGRTHSQLICSSNKMSEFPPRSWKYDAVHDPLCREISE